MSAAELAARRAAPPTLQSRLRVFVSSKMEELAEERVAVKAALDGLRVDAWVFEKDAGARAESIRSTYLDELDAADLYIGVFWKGYGGYTIDEYEAARKARKDCLIYEKRKGIDGRDTRLQTFLDGLGNVEGGLTVKWFQEAAELGVFVQEDVAAWQTRIVRARRRAGRDAPFQAPALRAGYVPRPDLLARVKARLLRDDPAAIELVGLSGMGGSGKSVMAVAAANDAEVGAHFVDGVLWSTLGTSPDATSILSGWIRALGDRESSFAGPEPARAHLQTLLRDRAVLLVLDDVWDADAARDLVVGGPACAVLITTREQGVARALGVQVEDAVEVGAMTEDEASAMLANRLGPVFDARRDVATKVSAAVGFLPLALDLIAAQVAEGASWDELLADLGAETARLEALDDPSLDDITDALATRRLSLISSLALSVKRLPRARLERFAWLGVFPDDARITALATATLWDTNERDARDTLRYLRSRALLLPAAADAAGNPTYTLHDVLHALARRILAAPAEAEEGVLPAGLGIGLPAAHARLLDHHAALRVAASWSSIPDDGYIHDHLTWHFERAGRSDEIHALMREETAAGGNAWFEARDAAGRFEAFAADARYAMALSRAREDAGALASRYALVLGSLNGLALAVPAPLLDGLLSAGVWTPAQALGYASQSPDPSRRVRSLAAVALRVPEPRRSELLFEAFHTARGLEDEAELFGWLSGRLADAGLLAEALELARGAEFGDARSSALIAVATHLDGEERAAVIAEAKEVAENTGEVFRSAAWSPVLPHLDRASLLEALGRCAEMKNAMARDWVAGAMIERLAALGRAEEALSRARALEDDVTRGGTLIAVAATLPEAERVAVLREALAIVARIDDEAHAQGIDDAFPELPSLMRSVLSMVVAGQSWRAAALRAIPAGVARPVIDDVAALLDNADDTFAVLGTAVTLHLFPEAERQRRRADALERLGTVGSAADRIKAAAELASVLEGKERARALDIGMAALAEITISTDRDDALRALGLLLDRSRLEAAVDLVASIDEEDERSSAIEALVPHLPAELLPRALTATRLIGDRNASLLARCALGAALAPDAVTALLEEAGASGQDYLCARAIGLLAPHLPANSLERAVEIARSLSFATAVSEVALPALARRFEPPARAALLESAIARASVLDDAERMAWALEAFRDQLGPDQLNAAVESMTAAAPRFDEDLRDFGVARILVAAAPALAGSARRQAIERVVALLGKITDEPQQSDLIALLAPVLDDETRAACLEAIGRFQDPYRRSLAYGLIAVHAPIEIRGHIVDDALAEFQHFAPTEYLSVNEQVERAGVHLLPYVAELDSALGLVERFEDAAQRGRALSALGPTLPADLRSRALELARAVGDADARAQAILALARTAPEVEREALLGEALGAAMAASTDLLHDETLAPIAQASAALHAARVRALFDAQLDQLALQPRPQILARLHALAPMILALRDATAEETMRAIADVTHWWP